MLPRQHQLIQLVHCRARRRFNRGLKRKPMSLIKRLRKAKKECQVASTTQNKKEKRRIERVWDSSGEREKPVIFFPCCYFADFYFYFSWCAAHGEACDDQDASAGHDHCP
jgi:hypothetical protein